MPFLVGAGNLSDSEISPGSTALSDFWGSRLTKYSCTDSPHEILSCLPKVDSLFQLNGDAGVFYSKDGCWIECLGLWRIPVILMVLPSPNGDIPGLAAAYVSLCYRFSVPLIGLVQLGGDWHAKFRNLDGLPWCGWVPNCAEINPIDNSVYPMDTFVVVENIRRRMLNLNL